MVQSSAIDIHLDFPSFCPPVTQATRDNKISVAPTLCMENHEAPRDCCVGCPDVATDDGSRKCGWLKTTAERYLKRGDGDHRAHPMLHGTMGHRTGLQVRILGSCPVVENQRDGTCSVSVFGV